MENVMKFISRQMNFTYSYVRAADRTWGIRQSNGSWTGMLGLLMREEVEVAAVPFIMTVQRNTWMKFTDSITHFEFKIFAARGRPEVDPWGFLLPLSPLVWVAVLTALLGVITVMMLLPSFIPQHNYHNHTRIQKGFNCVRVLLQQDILEEDSWWMWERVVVGVWMLMMLVVTKSYAGNLMSLLAVRHIDLPYETLRDVLDDPNVAIIVVPDQATYEYYRTATSGIYKEVGDLLDTPRVTYNRKSQFGKSMDTIVRAGTHIIFEVDTIFRTMMAQDFSRTGRCDFYIARSTYLSYSMGILSQKNSLMGQGMNRGVAWLVECGLFDKWLRFSQPNTTSCVNPPRTITVNAVLSLTNLWGMFVVLGFGFLLGVVLLLIEVVIDGVKDK